MNPHVRHSARDGELLAAADTLFEEFPHASVVEIARAMNVARKESRGSGKAPGVHAVLMRARELLAMDLERVSA